MEKPIEERGSLRRASWDAWEGTLDRTGRCPGQNPDFFLGCHQLTGRQAPMTYPALPIPLVFDGWNTESSAHTSGQIQFRASIKSLQFSMSQQGRAEA